MTLDCLRHKESQKIQWECHEWFYYWVELDATYEVLTYEVVQWPYKLEVLNWCCAYGCPYSILDLIPKYLDNLVAVA